MLNIKNKKIGNVILFFYIITGIAFAMPSIFYYIENKTILKFEPYFKFLLNDFIDRGEQTLIYIILLAIITILYFLILKNRKEIFENNKKIFLFILIISIIFVIVIPFTCSDVFYYLGIGRIDSKYNQNPYYTTIKEFVENNSNSKYLEEDTVLLQGYINDWSNSTVVYGPIWTIICKIVAFLSCGNIDIGLLIFKLINVFVHLLNCYLIYKISNKKIFTLIYGINPFILMEGIACVHNDIFMVLFILLSLYLLLKKKNIVLAIIALAIATSIKYFTIILLPFIIIYYFRKERTSKRFLKCIEYGLIFFITIGVCYLLYIRDFQVFSGLFIQQEKYAKSIYIIVLEYFNNNSSNAPILNKMLLASFAIIYFFTCIVELYKKEIKFRNETRKIILFILAFIFLLITNFQPWYIMWMFPFLIWQKSDDIKLIVGISIISEFANSVFLQYGEGWRYGTPFVFMLWISTGIYKIIIDRKRIKLLKQKS